MTIFDIILIATFLTCCYACYLCVSEIRKMKSGKALPSHLQRNKMDKKLRRALDKELSLDLDIVQDLEVVQAT